MSASLTLPRWLAPMIEIFVRLSQSDKPISYERLTLAVGMQPRSLERFRATLAEGGLLVGTRGKFGGTRLGRPAFAITMGDIYRACHESSTHPTGPFYEGWLDSGPWPASDVGKALEPQLRAFENDVIAAMDKITIADIAEAVRDYL